MSERDDDRRCGAIQMSDQMYCRLCGLVWDTNDPEPPACRLDEMRERAGALQPSYRPFHDGPRVLPGQRRRLWE